MLSTIIYFLGMVTSPVIIKLGPPKYTYDNIYDYYPSPPPPPPPPIHIWKDHRGNNWWNPPPPTEDYDGDSS